MFIALQLGFRLSTTYPQKKLDSFLPQTVHLVFLCLILYPFADFIRVGTSPASEPRTTSIARRATDRSSGSEGARSTSIDFLLKQDVVLASRIR